jgi:hypothetical protein
MARLMDAREYYEKCGFKFVDVPWAVSREAILMTRPPWVTGEPFSYEAGGERLYPVASAEQSFLQMQMDALASGPTTCQCSFAFPMSSEAMVLHTEAFHSRRITGSYCAITPCFRNETVLDDLHQPYFMKLELISWDKTTPEDLSKMIAGARLYIENDEAGLWIDVIKNDDPDPLSVSQAYDIVTNSQKIELGSYGIRSHPKVGRWVYGTGLAEPRYSYAIEVETALRSAKGTA